VDAGFDRSDISIVANDISGEYARYMELDDEDVSAGEGAGFGAVVGALVGLGVALIPGIGPVVAAGPLAAVLMTGIGAAAGAVTGGIVAGLIDFGVPEEHAQYYAEGVRRGGTLVTIYVNQDEWAERAQNVMNRFDPVDIEERSAEWQSTGWTSYDSSAEPYSAEELRQQRNTYGSTAAVANATTTYQPYTYYEPRFRTHYDTHYASSGYDYSVYAPAYRYGYTLATDPRYSDYDWERLEPEAHRYWDVNYPGTWDRIKDSIRDAWYEITGR
jgi:hypothetical protein